MLRTPPPKEGPSPAHEPMLSDLQEKKLTRYFQVYDIDDDGQIAASDFERVIENVRILRGASENSPAGNGLRSAFMSFWAALSDSADSDRDGGIDLDEWLAYWQVALAEPAGFRRRPVGDDAQRHRSPSRAPAGVHVAGGVLEPALHQSKGLRGVTRPISPVGPLHHAGRRRQLEERDGRSLSEGASTVAKRQRGEGARAQGPEPAEGEVHARIQHGESTWDRIVPACALCVNLDTLRTSHPIGASGPGH